MRKEKLEKYINKKVEITIGNHLGAGIQTLKGKLVKKDPALTEAILACYGIKYNDDWYGFITENKEIFNFHFKVVKKIKEVKDVSI
jgi:hypothetical protein